jgi:hypothetical protein
VAMTFAIKKTFYQVSAFAPARSCWQDSWAGYADDFRAANGRLSVMRPQDPTDSSSYGRQQ